MTNKAKFYKLALNLLDNHADIEISYNYDKKKYEPTTLTFDYRGCELVLALDLDPHMTLVKFINHNTEQVYLAVLPEDLDEVFEAIKDSNMDFLLEGIE